MGAGANSIEPRYEAHVAPISEGHRRAWSHPPVDGVGYLSSQELLELPDDELRNVVNQMQTERYSGWRNYENRWRDVLGLDETSGRIVLEYGCGLGVEALQYARKDNEVHVADIVRENVRLAQRVLSLWGFGSVGHFLQSSEVIPTPEDALDVIHCAGVLHHVENPVPVVEEFAKILKSGGELRLMLYSDEAWRIATGSEPPKENSHEHPSFMQFVRTWDGVGDYADWYNKPKLERLFGHVFRVTQYEPLTMHGEYVGVRMSPL